jgi:hypothetical protein
MSDRNTTIVTDSGSGAVVGLLVAVVAVLAILVFAFGWHPWTSVPAKGPTVNITAPAPAPAPTVNIIPAPAPAPAAGG